MTTGQARINQVDPINRPIEARRNAAKLDLKFGQIPGNFASTTTTDGTFKTITTISLVDDTSYVIDIIAEARRTDSAGRGGFERRGIFFREAAGIATQEGPTRTSLTERSSGNYNVRFLISVNNVLIQVRGAVGHTINWQVFYPINGVM